MDKNFLSEEYKGRRVLVTGHTGFKGTWLCMMLHLLGAEVTGYALAPETEPDLFGLSGLCESMASVTGDVRDPEHMKRVFDTCRPEVVFHLAAQPIVRESYRDPAGTYATNVMGTVNLMECVRLSDSVRSVVNVTTDKVYENRETERGYTEEDRLDGYDPYSNSKSCSELVTRSYVRSFLREQGVAVSACRAGNVIGGGDFEKDRIIPDCVRAALGGEPLIVRNPLSVRPYQHVLEPLAELFAQAWGGGFTWLAQGDGGPHEANLLRLDCHKIKNVFGWQPRYDAKTAVELVVEWTKAWLNGQDVRACMERQISSYFGLSREKGMAKARETEERRIGQ